MSLMDKTHTAVSDEWQYSKRTVELWGTFWILCQEYVFILPHTIK